MMRSLPWATWERLIVWMVIGLFIYFFYSRSHSKLARAEGSA
jgi:APA family basic amino acid/polyamine antiporter